MNSGDIQRLLYRHFVNYEYRLNNSFVYNWESDFFAMSGSGYFIEAEIKISRGDYFRDFDKDKHRLFKAIGEKRTHYTTGHEYNGDLICEFQTGSLKYNAHYGYDQRDSQWGMHNGRSGYWVNDFNAVKIYNQTKRIFAPASQVVFHEIAKYKLPNQFYFACPTDLIKLSEIPDYAGLIYCGSEAKVIRRAPYLHKKKQDLTRELLQKFYNLWEYKLTMESKINLNGQYKLFAQQDLKNAIQP